MKPDKLEEFIIDQKEEFNVFEPDDKIWENIKDKSTPVRKLSFRKIAWRVAAGITIFLASWLMNDWVQEGEAEHTIVAESQSDVQADDKMQVLMEAEGFYTSKINTAKEEIYFLSGNDDELMDILNYDLVELDQAFEELKNDLKDNSDNQEVIEAMIQNYRIKLQILEEILRQLSKSNKTEEKTASYEISM